MKVLSLFNGCSLALPSLERAGADIEVYAASEIDKFCNTVSAYRKKDIVMLGDVQKVRVKDLGFVPDIVIGGSPCQGFSSAGKQLGLEDPRSKLFWEFVRILKEAREVNPDVLFLLENVPMLKKDRAIVTEAMGVEPIFPDSSLVSAQKRPRAFWTNIALEPYGLFGAYKPNIPAPEDKGIKVSDIRLPDEDVDDKYILSDAAAARAMRATYSPPRVEPEKTGVIATGSNSNKFCIDAGTTLLWKRPRPSKIEPDKALTIKSRGPHAGVFETNDTVLWQRPRGKNNGGDISNGGKSPVIGSSFDRNTMLKMHMDGEMKMRRMTPIEVCRCFNVPDWWFFDDEGQPLVSESQMYKMCGNGWIVDLVAHILSFMPQKFKK